MRIIEPYIQLEDPINGETVLKRIERIGRVCYKSEEKITEWSAKKFVQNLIKRGHESVIEHVQISIRIVCDRGVSHEIVRHRIASYSQESTRYCNYSADKFGEQLTFIRPVFWDSNTQLYKLWIDAMTYAEEKYLRMISLGASPQEARSVLPNSLKTEIVVSMNLREWRHFIRMRTSPAAHPQMRQVANMVLRELKKTIPIVFDDFLTEEEI